MSFKALVLDKGADGAITSALRQVEDAQLPEGDVDIAVEYSTLNYKDGLCLTGKGGLVRQYPHVAGVDLAGRVAQSRDARFRPGDAVILTGWRVGEIRWGGYAEKARAKADWLVKMPEGMTTRSAMAIGTAGLTAMLAIEALEAQGLKPEAGEVLVTGAAGGVGSVAIMLLAGLGYKSVAVTGRPETEAYLKEIGATRILPRAALAEPSAKPLESEAWAGAIDSVGGTTLARLLGQMRYGASVAAVGLVGGANFPASVIPFLLRGVNLLGIDSVMTPLEKRRRAWERLARELPPAKLEAAIRPAKLADLPRLGEEILAGQIRGRVLVEIGHGGG